MPMKKELDAYECCHGMGCTKIRRERGGVEVSQTSLVPVDDNCEIHRVKVTNKSNAEVCNVRVYVM